MRASRGDVAVSRTLRLALRVYFVAFLVVLYLPTALLVVFSFNNSITQTFPLAGFTTRFYRSAFNNPDIVSAVENSLKVATAVGVVATLLGLAASYALARRSIRMKAAISALILVPLVVPTIALGIAILLLLKQGPLPIPLGLGAVGIGHVVLALPYTVLLILPRISAIDRRLEEAAHDLGASGPQTFRLIILPADRALDAGGLPDLVHRVGGRGGRRGVPALVRREDLPGVPVRRAPASGHGRYPDPGGVGDDHAVVRHRVPGRGAAAPGRAPARGADMIRIAVVVVLVTLAIGAGIALASRGSDTASAHVAPRAPTAQQLAYRKRYLAAILRNDPSVVCSCTAEHAAMIAGKKKP